MREWDGFNAEKMYTYVKGFAMGNKNMPQTIKALALARNLHSEQTRKSGEPYIVHPLTMVSHAIALGIVDDNKLATLLLHDVPEDCKVPAKALGMNEVVTKAVRLLTFDCPNKEDKEAYKRKYYFDMRESCEACIGKCFDRGHNVSSMAGVFTVAKLNEYLNETREHVLPLLRYTKDQWPELSDVLFILKYHIISVCKSIDATLDIIKQKS